MATVLDKARDAATNEVKKVGILIFLGVELLFFGVVFGVPITMDVNMGRVFAVLGFILTLIGTIGAIITYYEVYNDYLTANIPELQEAKVKPTLKAPKVQMLDNGEEVVKPRTVEARDLWADTPVPVPKPKQPRKQKTSATATT